MINTVSIFHEHIIRSLFENVVYLVPGTEYVKNTASGLNGCNESQGLWTQLLSNHMQPFVLQTSVDKKGN